MDSCCTCIRHTAKAREIVPKGLVRSSDQDGRRWAKGEVALKFVVKVNVAREKRMLYCKGG
jgi:hypothetical protein